MINSALLCAVLAATSATGQAVSVQGEVVLVRGQANYRLVDLSGITPGDEIRTGSSGAASILLSSTTLVYLAPNSQLAIREDQQPSMELLAGEVRIVSEEPSRVRVGTAHESGTVSLLEGSLRLQRSPTLLRLAVQQGRTDLKLGNRPVIRLQQSEEIQAFGNQIDGPFAADPNAWTLDLVKFQSNELNELSVPPSAKVPPSKVPAADPPPVAADPPPVAAESQERSSEEDINMRRPPSATQNQIASASISSSSTGLSASPGLSASAGLFADANQSTLQGMHVSDGTPFPGNIHLVTGETRYALNDVRLNAAEQSAAFPGGLPSYYSVGTGALPTGQVTTDLQTASNPTPRAIAVRGFDAYVLRLDQYGTVDATLDPAGGLNNNVGTTGFLGANPTAPAINGATALADERAEINSQVTFALGEIRLRLDGGTNNDSLEVGIRTSDQDRRIIKDPNGNDANDVVTPNSKVGQFDDVPDPRFLPAAPLVKVPAAGSFDNRGTRYSGLSKLRQAAVTTVIADQLHDYARRTGQTRFVVDGKVIDISGYRR